MVSMKKKPFENRIIIIGADHHNTLAAIRAFGREKCELVVIIHGQSLARKKIQVFSSKYVNKSRTHVIENRIEELIGVLEHYGSADRKDVLFPASDFAEYAIDSNAVSLSDRFCVPGFLGAPGKVCRMMDKWEQCRFAAEHGFKAPQTFVLHTTDTEIPPELTFPCIVKPRISALGVKTDIRICCDETELRKALTYYSAENYPDALVQRFVNKKYEILSMGSIENCNGRRQIHGGAFIKLREQLESATSFALFAIDNTTPTPACSAASASELRSGFLLDITDDAWEKLTQMNREVLQALSQMGYSGLYDIEYLLCEDEVFFNEINFRQSGAGYALVNKEINVPFMWACSVLGTSCRFQPTKSVEIGTNFMAELCDIIYVKRRTITMRQWIRDIRKAKAFAVYDRRDLRAVRKCYWEFAKAILRRGRCSR